MNPINLTNITRLIQTFKVRSLSMESSVDHLRDTWSLLQAMPSEKWAVVVFGASHGTNELLCDVILELIQSRIEREKFIALFVKGWAFADEVNGLNEPHEQPHEAHEAHDTDNNADFICAPAYIGARPGYEHRFGSSGMGYYRDYARRQIGVLCSNRHLGSFGYVDVKHLTRGARHVALEQCVTEFGKEFVQEKLFWLIAIAKTNELKQTFSSDLEWLGDAYNLMPYEA